MFPKSKRLNLKKDFKRVASGKKLETKYLKLFFKTGEYAQPRIGIAVSSNDFKKANERNRARRVASAALEAVYSKLLSGMSIVVLPKKGIALVKSADVLSDLEENLKNEKIIN